MNDSINKSVIEKGQILVDALRTIASGKKDYGESLDDKDYAECRKIAKNALQGTGRTL